MKAELFHPAGFFVALSVAAAVAVGTCGAHSARAAAAPLVLERDAAPYPSRSIRLLVPFPPGASTDSIARIIADPIESHLGVRVNIENRSGAGGNIGAEAVVRAPSDGHTWLLGTAGLLAINALLYPTMTFDPAIALVPVTLVAHVPYVLVVHPSLPVNSLSAFIRFAERRPWILNYGSAGTGSTVHLGAELFKALTQTKIVHIPYRGGAPALSDLMGGHLHMMFSSVPLAYPHVDSGRLRALVVTSPQRALHLPGVPTVHEAELPGLEFTGWFALLVPMRTPQRIVSWLNHELVTALSSAGVRSRIESIGAEPATSTPLRVYEMMRRDTDRWQRIIRSARIKPDWEDYPQ
jgi:tripartite-type tricarboxylate transporter receptor subunit TctC